MLSEDNYEEVHIRGVNCGKITLGSMYNKGNFNLLSNNLKGDTTDALNKSKSLNMRVSGIRTKLVDEIPEEYMHRLCETCIIQSVRQGMVRVLNND